jgi:hypothetical protein
VPPLNSPPAAAPTTIVVTPLSRSLQSAWMRRVLPTSSSRTARGWDQYSPCHVRRAPEKVWFAATAAPDTSQFRRVAPVRPLRCGPRWSNRTRAAPRSIGCAAANAACSRTTLAKNRTVALPVSPPRCSERSGEKRCSSPAATPVLWPGVRAGGPRPYPGADKVPSLAAMRSRGRGEAEGTQSRADQRRRKLAR